MKNYLPIKNSIPELELAVQAALEAGKTIMNIYNQKFSSTLKSDNEPLTKADIKSNKIIQKIISDSGYPILILGVVYCPTIHTLYLAQKDQGAFKSENGDWSRLYVSGVSELENCRAVGSRYHISDMEQNLIKRLNISKFTSKGSSLKVADVSSGSADLYFTTTNKIKQWDTCASYCLITEAGGKMTDMLGNDLEYNTENLNHENGLLVSNGLIHNDVISIYREFLSENV